jgi:hypothetical protein
VARERHPRRLVLANPDEPKTGDYEFGLYEKAHPHFGDKETVARIKKGLRGLRGEKVRMFLKGSHGDGEEVQRFRIQRTFNYRRYSDVFGPGSAYASAIHAVKDKYSDQQLVTYSLEFQIVDDDADDEDSEL